MMIYIIINIFTMFVFATSGSPGSDPRSIATEAAKSILAKIAGSVAQKLGNPDNSIRVHLPMAGNRDAEVEAGKDGIYRPFIVNIMYPSGVKLQNGTIVPAGGTLRYVYSWAELLKTTTWKYHEYQRSTLVKDVREMTGLMLFDHTLRESHDRPCIIITNGDGIGCNAYVTKDGRREFKDVVSRELLALYPRTVAPATRTMTVDEYDTLKTRGVGTEHSDHSDHDQMAASHSDAIVLSKPSGFRRVISTSFEDLESLSAQKLSEMRDACDILLQLAELHVTDSRAEDVE